MFLLDYIVLAILGHFLSSLSRRTKGYICFSWRTWRSRPRSPWRTWRWRCTAFSMAFYKLKIEMINYQNFFFLHVDQINGVLYAKLPSEILITLTNNCPWNLMHTNAFKYQSSEFLEKNLQNHGKLNALSNLNLWSLGIWYYTERPTVPMIAEMLAKR